MLYSDGSLKSGPSFEWFEKKKKKNRQNVPGNIEREAEKSKWNNPKNPHEVCMYSTVAQLEFE